MGMVHYWEEPVVVEFTGKYNKPATEQEWFDAFERGDFAGEYERQRQTNILKDAGKFREYIIQRLGYFNIEVPGCA